MTQGTSLYRCHLHRNLFEYSHGEVNILEVKFKNEAAGPGIQKAVTAIMGKDFVVQNRYQQNDLFYKTMQTEKWAIFLILIFILIVASFNVIGTLDHADAGKEKGHHHPSEPGR